MASGGSPSCWHHRLAATRQPPIRSAAPTHAALPRPLHDAAECVSHGGDALRVVRRGEADAVGFLFLVILDELRVDADRLSQGQRFLLGLVKIVLAIENGETRGDRPVEEVGLGEAKHEAALEVAKLGGEGQSFAETQEIIGLVGQADKGAGESADAPLQSDGLLALFLELEIEIDGAILGVALDLDGFVFLDALEVIELIEAKDADLKGDTPLRRVRLDVHCVRQPEL